LANLIPREKCYEKHNASGEAMQIAMAVRGQKFGIACSADAGRVMYNKCGRGADSGQKLLMRCGQQAQTFCPHHLQSGVRFSFQ